VKTLEVLEKVLKGKRLRPKTQKNYRMAFGSLARFSEEFPSDSVVINEWTSSLNHLGDGTVRTWFSFVNAGGKYVEKIMGRNENNTYRVPNPCVDAERPRVSKKRRRYFSPQELGAIIRACKDETELLLVLTLIDSACRIGELVGLVGKDVGDGFIDVAGKTGQRRYRLDMRICERLHVLAGGDNKPVFRHQSGGFFPSGDGLGHRVRRITERAGLTGARLGVHTIRHSSASLLARETGQALIVKALLQHDDIATSMGYIHDVDDMVVKDDKYSPVRILGEQVKGSSQSPLRLGEGRFGSDVAVVPVDGGDELDGLLRDLFPGVKDGVAVRTVLRSEDLRLVRDAFICYARHNNDGKVTRASALMKRMLRKGGSEFYSRK